MWIGIKALSSYVGVSPRTIQMRISTGSITARKKDRKSYEVDTTSLPAEWIDKLPAELRPQISPLSVLMKNPERSLSAHVTSAIGRPLSDKERKLYGIYQFYTGQKAAYSRESDRVRMTASYFGISESSVRRALAKVEKGGVISPERKEKSSAWDAEAESYLKSYYLQLLHDRNINSKIAAYKAVVRKAQEEGWKIGCRASAYNLLSSIPRLIMEYAAGGDRALDNIFYIKRDWSNLKPAQILIGDQHRADFWVKEEKKDGTWRYFRPEFYVWEDAASRCIAGIAVAENYSSDTVKEALYMAIRRFGLFDCTYNDNGTSECSAVVTQIIDELIALSGGKTKMMDISELYRTKENLFVIEDEEGNIIDTAPDLRTWRQMHRRIYANVKNAKTKPIERLFNTLETMMAEDGIPGHVVTPGAPAHVEEKESLMLEKMKEADEILTLDEFIYAFISTINKYEHTTHSSLGISPAQFVERQIQNGWRADLPANMNDLDFIFMERKNVRVTKGRVTVNRIQYMGEDLRSNEDGNLEDVGLHLYEGEKVEVRYDPMNTDRAYAVIPKSAFPVRALTRVRSIEMLDEEEMQKGIEWKRHSMKLVRQAFRNVAYPDQVRFETGISSQVEKADRPVIEQEKKEALERIRSLMEPVEEKRPKNVLHFFSSRSERFRWCLEELIQGRQMSDKDLLFVQEYRTSEEYAQDRDMWATYERFGGLI